MYLGDLLVAFYFTLGIATTHFHGNIGAFKVPTFLRMLQSFRGKCYEMVHCVSLSMARQWQVQINSMVSQ